MERLFRPSVCSVSVLGRRTGVKNRRIDARSTRNSTWTGSGQTGMFCPGQAGNYTATPLLPEKGAWWKEKYKQKYVYCASTHNYLMFDASCCLLCFDISINGCFLLFRCLWIYKYVLLMMCSGKKYSHEFYFIHEMFLIWVVFFSGCSYWGLKVTGAPVSLSFCFQ